MAQDQGKLEMFESIIRTFLIEKKNWKFRFLRVGEMCNGNFSFAFSGAECGLSFLPTEPQDTDTPPRFRLGVVMTQLFDAGYKILEEYADPDVTSKKFLEEEEKALQTLKNFIQKIDDHEKHIQSALRNLDQMRDKKETVITTTLAEHLFSKLSPGKKYLVDERVKSKKNLISCNCGCGNFISYGATGVGHSKVWHGYIDIMMMTPSAKPESAAKVSLDLDPKFAPTEAKRAKFSDEEDMDSIKDENGLLSTECISEVKTTLAAIESIKNQIASQTIVFALAYQIKNPSCKVFIPNIVISPYSFYIVMYNPENDILLWSEKFPLMDNEQVLQVSSIIALWMVLHYKLFCNGAEIFDDLKEIKACFKERISSSQWSYYEQLEIGASNLVVTHKCDFAGVLCSDNIQFPKMKLKTHRSF